MKALLRLLKRLFGRKKPTPPPIPPPPIPSPVPEPLPEPPIPAPSQPKFPYGFFLEDCPRWGDFSHEIRETTTLYYCGNKFGYERSTDDPPGAYFPLMRSRLARECGSGGRKLFFDLGLHLPDILLRKSLETLLPVQDQLAFVSLGDEPDWSKGELEDHAAQVRNEMTRLGLEAPLGIVLAEQQMTSGMVRAVGLDFIAIEAYLPAPGPETPEAAAEAVRRKVSDLAAKIPDTRGYLVIGQAYSRNFQWTNLETLAAIQFPTYLAAVSDPRCLGALFFAWGRPSGAREYPALRAEHANIWTDIKARG